MGGVATVLTTADAAATATATRRRWRSAAARRAAARARRGQSHKTPTAVETQTVRPCRAGARGARRPWTRAPQRAARADGRRRRAGARGACPPPLPAAVGRGWWARNAAQAGSAVPPPHVPGARQRVAGWGGGGFADPVVGGDPVWWALWGGAGAVRAPTNGVRPAVKCNGQEWLAALVHRPPARVVCANVLHPPRIESTRASAACWSGRAPLLTRSGAPTARAGETRTLVALVWDGAAWALDGRERGTPVGGYTLTDDRHNSPSPGSQKFPDSSNKFVPMVCRMCLVRCSRDRFRKTEFSEHVGDPNPR